MNNDEQFYELVRRINSSHTPEIVAKALKLIESAEQPESYSDSDSDEDMEAFGIPKNIYQEFSLHYLHARIGKLQDEIDALRNYCDHDIDPFIIDIQKNIVDYTTAIDAYYNYNSQFFYELPYSQLGKQKIATAILESCALYMKEASNPIWMNVINSKPLDSEDNSESVNGNDQVRTEKGPIKESE